MAAAEKVIKRAAKWNKKDDSKPLELLEQVKQNMADEQQENENISSRVNRDFIKVDSGEVSDSSSIQRYTILDLFRNRYLIKLSCIIWYTWCVNSLTYYGLFLTSSTFAGDRFLNYFLSCLVELPSAFVFWSIINRFVVDSSGATSTASTVFSLIGKFAVTGSWTTIYLSTPELYPTNLRNAAFGMASAAARIGGMIAPYSSLLASRIQWGPGVVFGSCCVIVTFLTLFLPETRKEELPRSLNDVVVMCKRKGKNKA
ncbi:hypothetical protein KUTeg_001327 [Tegillarca granosa]|uniref:Uncharacterized protein n=1 Tax=Tegillarca granosa TaxID=220873 RepID=A0ABQ9FVH1_TEGGR|nr:hypothetical protein KUTeg_001327 [Tegillarca granosa]